MKILKLILLSFLFTSFLNAEYLLTVNKTEIIGYGWNQTTTIVTQAKCIKSYSFSNNQRLYFYDISKKRTYYYNLDDVQNYKIESGYYYDSGNKSCKKFNSDITKVKVIESDSLNSNNLSLLGLEDSQLNFIFAVCGVIIGSFFVYGLYRTA